MSILCSRSLVAACTALAVVACTHPRDVTVAYGGAPAPQLATGAVEVVLNRASGALSITVNDALVVDRKYSRRARVDGIPAGPARIQIATGGGCEQAAVYDRDVDVVPGGTVTLALPGPEPNHGCMVYAGLTYIGMHIAMATLALVAVVAAGSAESGRAR